MEHAVHFFVCGEYVVRDALCATFSCVFVSHCCATGNDGGCVISAGVDGRARRIHISLSISEVFRLQPMGDVRFFWGHEDYSFKIYMVDMVDVNDGNDVLQIHNRAEDPIQMGLYFMISDISDHCFACEAPTQNPHQMDKLEWDLQIQILHNVCSPELWKF